MPSDPPRGRGLVPPEVSQPPTLKGSAAYSTSELIETAV